jgi:Fe-S cluster biosynthesis and repair protein YggX
MTDSEPRMVMCTKLGRLAPALEKPPFPGPLGQRIYDEVSAEGYDLWKPHMTILINHYALNPADPDTRIMLRQQMEEFFFGEDARVSEDWETPEEAGPAQRKK